MTETHTYKTGDRVIATGWNRRAGRIEKIGRGASVMVLWDGDDKPNRANLDGIRLETADDVAKREHKQFTAEWRAAIPSIRIARVQYSPRYGSYDETGATVTACTPAEMRQAADELIKLADWFERRPQESK